MGLKRKRTNKLWRSCGRGSVFVFTSFHLEKL